MNNINIINVSSNINSTQIVLHRLPHEEAMIGLTLKIRLGYKTSYLTGNVRPSYVMSKLHAL